MKDFKPLIPKATPPRRRSAWWSWRAVLVVALVTSVVVGVGPPSIAEPLGYQADTPLELDAVSSDASPASADHQPLKNRLLAVAITLSVVVIVVAVAYGYLKLELFTRGFYSGRLQIAALIVAIAVAVGGYFCWAALVGK